MGAVHRESLKPAVLEGPHRGAGLASQGQTERWRMSYRHQEQRSREVLFTSFVREASRARSDLAPFSGHAFWELQH